MYSQAPSAPNSNPSNNNANNIPLNPLNNSQPIYNINISIYLNNHPHSAYNQQPIPVPPARQGLLRNQSSQIAIRQLISKSALRSLALWTIIELIFFIVLFFIPWFEYCYWEFRLNTKHKSISSSSNLGDNKDNIADFYNEICPGNPYPMCPDLCASIENVKYSGIVVYVFGSVCICISVLTFVLEIIKYKNPDSRISKHMLYVMNASTLILYLI